MKVNRIPWSKLFFLLFGEKRKIKIYLNPKVSPMKKKREASAAKKSWAFSKLKNTTLVVLQDIEPQLLEELTHEYDMHWAYNKMAEQVCGSTTFEA